MENIKVNFIKDFDDHGGNANMTKAMDMIKKVSLDYKKLDVDNIKFWNKLIENPADLGMAIVHSHLKCVSDFCSEATGELNDPYNLEITKHLARTLRLGIATQLTTVLEGIKCELDPDELKFLASVKLQCKDIYKNRS